MKNTMRKGFLLVAMLAVVLAVGLAFVSCDTGMAGVGLEGTWQNSTGTIVFRFSGNGATFTQLPSSGLWRDAQNKGYIKVNDPKFRNLRRTGNNEWTGESRTISYNTSSPSVALGANWASTNITLSANSRTLSEYTPSTREVTMTWTRRQ